MQLSALYRYPLKSAIAEPLQTSAIEPLGLAGDRRWMLVDEATGRFLSQRAEAHMSQLGAAHLDDGLRLSAPGLSALFVPTPTPDAALRGVTVWRDTLRVPDAGDEAAAWVSSFIGKPTRLVQLPAERARFTQSGYGLDTDRVGFADGFPLLLIGQASLDDLSRRVGRPLEMLRFRPNLVVSGSEAFAEDGWKRIRIGDTELRVITPCARCILTTLDPRTGVRSEDREPLATLKTYRQVGGDVQFGQNLVSEGEGWLQVGMPVEVID
ncbi:MOSC domain-containing protein [Pseudomonas eucalypticola]|uniref:MOSC domain-containing protein n=2 Tax=Pseudomonas TaxID=286 RepID=A0A7D5D6R6_9PSED|nr:MOSC domain-containing protein [Pseudomonas eucalypticola]QKZ04092.1 MOSC domain-containing protein [Pseudomonas eucalypticola]